MLKYISTQHKMDVVSTCTFSQISFKNEYELHFEIAIGIDL